MPLPEGRARTPQCSGQPPFIGFGGRLLALTPVDIDADAHHTLGCTVRVSRHHASALQNPQPAIVERQDPVFVLEECAHTAAKFLQPTTVVGGIVRMYLCRPSRRVLVAGT